MKKTINVSGETYRLTFDVFDEDVDVESLLRIDNSNLIGELSTWPVIVNRFGILLADAEKKVSETKLNLEILEAKTKDSIRMQMVEEGVKPTVDALNNAIILNKAVQAVKRKYIDCQKQRDYINSIFWNAKDKSQKIEKLCDKILPSDIPDSVIEGRVNNVLIKKKKNLIK